MKQPSLEEVKEYFKNAKKVKCAFDSEESNITKNIEREIYFDGTTGYWIDLKHTQIKLWCFREGYAKILTYKEKTFSITESQIKKLKEHEGSKYVEEWFPEAFENEVKLEVGKWYRAGHCLICLKEIDGNSAGVYGFSEDSWYEADSGFKIIRGHFKLKEATEQEVFEALKNEALKRGFKKGISIIDLYPDHSNNEIVSSDNFDWEEIHTGEYALRDSDGAVLFYQGVWAEIIPTITLSEAEQQLKKKIIV